MASIMTVRAPKELQELLKQMAAQRGFTRNALILQILQAWVEEKNQSQKQDRGAAAGVRSGFNSYFA